MKLSAIQPKSFCAIKPEVKKQPEASEASEVKPKPLGYDSVSFSGKVMKDECDGDE